MKGKDVLLERWAEILARKGDSPAIFDAAGRVVRTFRQIETRAEELAPEIRSIGMESVLAVQISNHEDWPSIFISCLRSRIIVLPLEQSITEQQRNAAFKVSSAAALLISSGGGR